MMFKKITKFCIVSMILLTCIVFTSLMKASTGKAKTNYSLKTIAKVFPARKINSGKDAYEVVMKHNKVTTKNSHYKNSQKIKHGYAIAYYNDVNQLTVYRVTLNQYNIVKIQKKNNKKIIKLKNKKLGSFKNAFSVLRRTLNYNKLSFKPVTKKRNLFVIKIFNDHKFIGTYLLRSENKKYNKIVEDDSRFELAASSHEKILNNKESKILTNAVKIVRKYRNKKLNNFAKNKLHQANKIIAYDNKLQ